MKMHIAKTQKLSLVVVGLFAAAVVGCGKKEPTEAVRQRVEERWELLTTHQTIKAYEYLSPGYRATHTLEQYVAFVATTQMRWKSAAVESVECAEEVCTAHLVVNTVLPGQIIKTHKDLDIGIPTVEKWVSSDGNWYFLPGSGISSVDVLGKEGESKASAQGAAQESSSASSKANPPLPASKQ